MFPCRTNLRQFSIRFQGPKFFNSLSNNIKDWESISLFSKKLKEFLVYLSILTTFLFVCSCVVISLCPFFSCYKIYDQLFLLAILNWSVLFWGSSFAISLLVFLWASLSLFTWLASSIVKHYVKPNGKKWMNGWMNEWMISALSLCPMSPSSHFLNNHSLSLFSWMDLNANQSLCSVWSRGLVSRRKSLVPVYSDLFNTIWK